MRNRGFLTKSLQAYEKSVFGTICTKLAAFSERDLVCRRCKFQVAACFGFKAAYFLKKVRKCVPIVSFRSNFAKSGKIYLTEDLH